MVEPVAVNVPFLLKLPPILCVKAPAIKVVPAPIVIFLPMVIPTTPVVLQVPEVVKSLQMLIVPTCSVLMPLPLSIRFPYDCDEFKLPTVWFAPLYSTVLVQPIK